MTEAEKAYQYFVIAVPENEEQAKAYFWARKALQSTLTQPNEPLTLEVLAKSQLLQMLGEKVEVIRMGEMCQAEWATVRSFGDCKTDSGCSCCHELYGKTWIAYRRPPEGEEEEKHVIEITENL